MVNLKTVTFKYIIPPPLLSKNEKSGKVITLRKVFGTTLRKKIGKILYNVITILEQ
jgi:hypothetical protein